MLMYNNTTTHQYHTILCTLNVYVCIIITIIIHVYCTIMFNNCILTKCVYVLTLFVWAKSLQM